MASIAVDRTARHLRLLTDTIAAVNSTLDLGEVFQRIASKVAEAMATDACFVYLYDEASGMLELRATHGTRFDDPAHRPRMASGRGDHRRRSRRRCGRSRSTARPTSTLASSPSRTCPRTSTSRSWRCRCSRATSWPGRSTCARATRASSPRTRSSCCRRSPARSARRSRTPSSTSARSGGWPSWRRWPRSAGRCPRRSTSTRRCRRSAIGRRRRSRLMAARSCWRPTTASAWATAPGGRDRTSSCSSSPPRRRW